MKETIITSSILIICIALLRRLCRGKISAGLQYALWLIVAFRLIMPAVDLILPDLLPESQFSIMNMVQRVETRAQDYVQIPERIGQINIPGGLPFVHMENEDGPTAVFVAGKVGWTWLDFFKGVWCAGMVIVGVWMATVNILFMRRLRGSRTRYENEDYKLPIYYVKDLSSPCLYGIGKWKAVYLPLEIAEEEEKIKHVLAHEYCHYKHKDIFWATLRCALAAVYWFNPLIWLAAVLSKQDCELACDEAAIKMLGEEERIAYGKTLLDLITKRTKASDIVCTATTMTGAGKGIKERIEMIAQKPHRLALVLLPLLIVVGVVVAFTFTQAKEDSENLLLLESEGEQTVTTDCFQIVFPESIAADIYYTVENDTDVIIYNKSYGNEIGRFCKLSYEDAMTIAGSREMFIIGGYGYNSKLESYMNGEDAMHQYYSKGVVSDSTETMYTPSGNTEHLPAPEDVDSEIINLPFYPDENYQQEGVIKEQNYDYLPNEEIIVTHNDDSESISEHTYTPNEESSNYTPDEVNGNIAYDENQSDEGVAGTDENVSTIILHDEDNYVEFLPDEQITTQSIPKEGYCYLYIPADSSEVEENIRLKLEEINEELIDLIPSVTVLSISMNSMEEILEGLIENRHLDVGDSVPTSAVASMLPEAAGLTYTMLELMDKEPYVLNLYYRLWADDTSKIDQDTIFVDAVLMFALIENMERCSFHINGDINTIKNSGSMDDFISFEINYERIEMEELFGELYTCSETKEGFIDLYNRVLEYLNENGQSAVNN